MNQEKIGLVEAVHKARARSTKLLDDPDAIAIFRETAKGMGKVRLHPHEAYEEELEENKGNP